MPKSRAAATIGRSQPGRPPAPVGTPQQAEGPRTLRGALVLPIEQIVPDPGQPRTSQDTRRLEELAASLREYGVLQPLLVREDGFLDDGRTRYMIVAGGRRYAAAQLAGLSRLPVVVRDTEGANLRMTQLVENVQRQDLTPLEEARAYQELIEAQGLSAEALGKRLGLSGQQVRDRVLLLSDQVVSDAVQRQQLPATVASEMLRLADAERASLRRRLESGEHLDRSAVREVRAQAKAAGVTNPRAKGGGRATRPKHPSAVTEAPRAGQMVSEDQSGFDPTSPAHTFTEALRALDRAALGRLLVYGAERQWSCQDLLRVIDEAEPAIKT